MKIDVIKKISKPFNKGTNIGLEILRKSIKYLGVGRSILVDKNNVIISGNKVYETCVKSGINKVVVVETTGDTLVVVKRTDIDIDTKIGMELQLVDNLSTEQNLNWDTNRIIDYMNDNYSFDPRRWGGYNCIVKELTLEEYLKENTPIARKPNKTENNKLNDGEFKQLTLF